MVATLTMPAAHVDDRPGGFERRRYWQALCGYALVTLGLLVLIHFWTATDYVGPDNDDAMRLVEVRNFLGGQGWFDLMERRLGLGDGTLMHWSRLIDLPIASLIRFFGLFLEPLSAEAAALFVWPVFLAVPTLGALGLAGRRIGGPVAMHIAFGLGAFLLVTSNRFLPGAIDHHNVQLLLVALIAVMLVDRRQRPSSFAVAGLAASVAIAIGAETTPLVAVSCLVVAGLWAWHGAAFARPAAAFALSLTVSISILFVATMPPQRYADVACDALSLGYYGIASVGGGLMFAAALVASRLSRGLRMAVLVGIGAAVLVTAGVIAPECLRSPLADLDPLLKALWLDSVTEAQPFMAQLRTEPGTLGAFYAIGFFAIAVCICRVVSRDRVETHAILLPLLLMSWVIALIQVRGAIFANMLAILPLSLLIAQLRQKSHREPENMGAGFLYLVTALISVPSVWGMVGVLATEGTVGLTGRMPVAGSENAESKVRASCTSQTALQQLAGLDRGVVAASSEMGAPILRFTHHSVLSAPYHRNQGGMLTELHIGMSRPDEAAAFLRGAKVSWLAFCGNDGQTQRMAAMKKDGLYAELEKGRVPPYLEPLPQPQDSEVQVFRVNLTSR